MLAIDLVFYWRHLSLLWKRVLIIPQMTTKTQGANKSAGPHCTAQQNQLLESDKGKLFHLSSKQPRPIKMFGWISSLYLNCLSKWERESHSSLWSPICPLMMFMKKMGINKLGQIERITHTQTESGREIEREREEDAHTHTHTHSPDRVQQYCITVDLNNAHFMWRELWAAPNEQKVLHRL